MPEQRREETFTEDVKHSLADIVWCLNECQQHLVNGHPEAPSQPAHPQDWLPGKLKALEQLIIGTLLKILNSEVSENENAAGSQRAFNFPDFRPSNKQVEQHLKNVVAVVRCLLRHLQCGSSYVAEEGARKDALKLSNPLPPGGVNEIQTYSQGTEAWGDAVSRFRDTYVNTASICAAVFRSAYPPWSPSEVKLPVSESNQTKASAGLPIEVFISPSLADKDNISVTSQTYADLDEKAAAYMSQSASSQANRFILVKPDKDVRVLPASNADVSQKLRDASLPMQPQQHQGYVEQLSYSGPKRNENERLRQDVITKKIKEIRFGSQMSPENTERHDRQQIHNTPYQNSQPPTRKPCDTNKTSHWARVKDLHFQRSRDVHKLYNWSRNKPLLWKWKEQINAQRNNSFDMQHNLTHRLQQSHQQWFNNSQQNWPHGTPNTESIKDPEQQFQGQASDIYSRLRQSNLFLIPYETLLMGAQALEPDSLSEGEALIVDCEDVARRVDGPELSISHPQQSFLSGSSVWADWRQHQKTGPGGERGDSLSVHPAFENLRRTAMMTSTTKSPRWGAPAVQAERFGHAVSSSTSDDAEEQTEPPQAKRSRNRVFYRNARSSPYSRSPTSDSVGLNGMNKMFSKLDVDNTNSRDESRKASECQAESEPKTKSLALRSKLVGSGCEKRENSSPVIKQNVSFGIVQFVQVVQTDVRKPDAQNPQKVNMYQNSNFVHHETVNKNINHSWNMTNETAMEDCQQEPNQLSNTRTTHDNAQPQAQMVSSFQQNYFQQNQISTRQNHVSPESSLPQNGSPSSSDEPLSDSSRSSAQPNSTSPSSSDEQSSSPGSSRPTTPARGSTVKRRDQKAVPPTSGRRRSVDGGEMLQRQVLGLLRNWRREKGDLARRFRRPNRGRRD